MHNSTFLFHVCPLGKPRQTRSDKWKKRPCVLAYRSFADEVRIQAKQMQFTFPESGAEILFHLPVPESWSDAKKQAMVGKPHRSKPDLDNMLKALMDALLPDDSVVWEVRASKRWGYGGCIYVNAPDPVFHGISEPVAPAPTKPRRAGPLNQRR